MTKENKIREEETRNHWERFMEFLIRHRKQAKVAGNLLYFSEMDKALESSENWYKNVFGEKALSDLKTKLEQVSSQNDYRIIKQNGG